MELRGPRSGGQRVIRVERGAADAPADLVGPSSPGEKERRRAEALYLELESDPGRDPASDFRFDFRAYKRNAVKQALDRLFHGKCAYCETRYGGSQPMDVEHWRPKGLAHRDNGLPDMRPGYYWLAADWDNLLPSCIDCNRARVQFVPPATEPMKVGKGNQFPVEDEATRVQNHQAAAAIEHEVPLILHPCIDNPAEHLEFTAEAVARARTDAAGSVSQKGERSIHVYALNRSGLVFARREVLDLIVQRKFSIEHLMEIHDEIQGMLNDPRKERLEILVEELLLHELRGLRDLTRPERSYSLLATQFVGEFLEDVRRTLALPS